MNRTHRLGILCALAQTGSAIATVPLDLTGLGGTGVTAHLDFTYASSSDTAATLTIGITNTTAAGIGGFVTGFAFNVSDAFNITSIAGDVDGSLPAQVALPGPNEAGWFGRFDRGGIGTPNAAGDFDFGVKNNDNPAFIQGGNGTDPNIAIGETTLFTLDLIGTGLDDLTNAAFESAFLSELSTGVHDVHYNFGIRFQGLTNGGSDLATPGRGTQPLSVPGAALLGLLGLSGVAALRSRNGTAIASV